MSRRFLLASFEREEDLLAATEAARARGYTIVDVFTPYAVHGLERAMGLAPSRLPWACFLGGATGLSIAIALQVWTSAVDWPLNVGGKPFVSGPAFVPVAFELTVLLAGLTAFAATFVRSGLYPGKRAVVLPRTTDDRFTIALEDTGPSFSVVEARALLAAHHVAELSEMVEPAPGSAPVEAKS